MSCSNPLKGFILGLKENGKQDLVIARYECDHLELDSRNKWKKVYSSSVTPSCQRVIKSYTELPCGQCLGCRLEHSAIWADRCMLEMKYHDSNYFLTLTYNDENLPTENDVDIFTGETLETKHMTLVKRDLQLFWKKLRNHFPDQNIRYFACGEYGEKYKRPHYHAIVFGLKLDDLKEVGKSSIGNKFYESEELNKCWTNGFVSIAEANYETCAYTARYVTKKATENLDYYYELNNIVKPYIVMSRKPGIGKQYYEDNDVFEYEYINLSTQNGGRKVKPPRYYEKLLEIDNPTLYKSIKLKHKETAEYSKKLKMSQTDKEYLQLLKDEEYVLSQRTKSLKREEF